MKGSPDLSPPEFAVPARVRRINRTWFTRAGLAEVTGRYLDHLESTRPKAFDRVCHRALAAARQASAEQADPKPVFYAALFSEATRAERNDYLRGHFFTRLLSSEMQINPSQYGNL